MGFLQLERRQPGLIFGMVRDFGSRRVFVNDSLDSCCLASAIISHPIDFDDM